MSRICQSMLLFSLVAAPVAADYFEAPIVRAPAVAPGVPSQAYMSASHHGPYGPGYGAGFGFFPPFPMIQPRAGAALQGMASLTAATGQYYQDVQQASLMREQSRQASIETHRKQLEFEAWYERVKPTAGYLRDKDAAAMLDYTRKGPSSGDIWSGKALNILLKSVLATPGFERGEPVELSKIAIDALNLTDGSTRGSLGLAKDAGKIDWPDALMDKSFDTRREDFSRNFQIGMNYVNQGKVPERALLRELQSNLKRMEDLLDDEVQDIPAGDYITARRTLNKLKDTVRGMGNAQVVKANAKDWRAEIRTAADLASYCAKNGLEFGPAMAASDYAGYNATFFAMRRFEGSLQGVARK
jgi:hypothetical protein